MPQSPHSHRKKSISPMLPTGRRGNSTVSDGTVMAWSCSKDVVLSVGVSQCEMMGMWLVIGKGGLREEWSRLLGGVKLGPELDGNRCSNALAGWRKEH